MTSQHQAENKQHVVTVQSGLELSEGWVRVSESVGGWVGGRFDGCMDGRTDVQMDG